MSHEQGDTTQRWFRKPAFAVVLPVVGVLMAIAALVLDLTNRLPGSIRSVWILVAMFCVAAPALVRLRKPRPPSSSSQT